MRDRPEGQGNGIVGKVIVVYDDSRFRIRTDPTLRYPDGREYEFSTAGELGVQVQFLDGEVR